MMYAIDGFSLGRRAFLGGVASVLALQLGGCGSVTRPRLVGALLDRSASVRPGDWDSYQTSFHNLVYSLQPSQEAEEADKLILAPIGDAPLSQLNTILSATITYVGTPDRPQQIEGKREELLRTISQLKPQAASQQTRIFDSLAAVAELFAADAGRVPELLVCSDMLEDSPIARFEVDPPTEEATARILGQLKSGGLLPDFRGAGVHVTGGGGRDGATYGAVKRFWEAYFRAAKAGPVRYMRAPLDFPVAEAS